MTVTCSDNCSLLILAGSRQWRRFLFLINLSFSRQSHLWLGSGFVFLLASESESMYVLNSFLGILGILVLWNLNDFGDLFHSSCTSIIIISIDSWIYFLLNSFYLMKIQIQIHGILIVMGAVSAYSKPCQWYYCSISFNSAVTHHAPPPGRRIVTHITLILTRCRNHLVIMCLI